MQLCCRTGQWLDMFFLSSCTCFSALGAFFYVFLHMFSGPALYWGGLGESKPETSKA
jgi:hypothetical protein